MSALIRAMVARKRAAAANDEAFRLRHDQIVAEAKGDTGPMPDHEWKGTKLRFEKPDGTWGDLVDLKGKPGKDGGVAVVGGGGARFDPSQLPPVYDPTFDDYLVLERNGLAYRVQLSTLAPLFSGDVPANAVTLNGTPITINGSFVTVT